MMNTTGSSIVTRPNSFLAPSNPTFVVILYQYGLGCIFLLGFTGNLASIRTFLRPILRTTSTGCLFLIVGICDTMFLLISVFDFVEVGIIQRPIFLSDYDNFCRFRWFARGFIRFCSAWILVLVAIDRWIRACYPFKTKQWCTRRNAFIVTSCIIIFGVVLHSFMLSGLHGRFFPGIPSLACGPLNRDISYVYFYFIDWPIIQVTFLCVIPVILTLASSMKIHYILNQEKRRVQPIRIRNRQQIRKSRTQRHMLILMITSTMLFCTTTLPISLRQIVTAFLIAAGITGGVNDSIIQEAVLTILLSLNYASNFYIHCLASNLFRNEFVQCIKNGNRPQQSTMLDHTAGHTRHAMRLTTNHMAPVEFNNTQTHDSHQL